MILSSERNHLAHPKLITKYMQLLLAPKGALISARMRSRLRRRAMSFRCENVVPPSSCRPSVLALIRADESEMDASNYAHAPDQSGRVQDGREHEHERERKHKHEHERERIARSDNLSAASP